MKKGFGKYKKILALLLCLGMVAGWLPNITVPAAAVEVSQIRDKTVDPSTIHNWQTYFGSNVMSTEYVGGVWTDKTVFQSFADYLTA